MASDFETCRNNLEGLLSWYDSQVTEQNRNEATTRLQLIDRLLFECLGWEREDCQAEEPHGEEYTDYSLYCPIRSTIVEAKKEGIYFELPAGYSKLEYSLKSLCRDNPQIKHAIGQAVGYCQRRGTLLAAVCNGHQLVAFVASRDDGKPPLEGKAIVFQSLQKMLDDFQQFWKYLSKPGVQERNLQRHLLEVDVPHIPPKLSSSISVYPGIKGRNVLQTDLQIVAELVIEDVAKAREVETDFIRQCFCRTGVLSQYAVVSKSILKHRYSALFGSKSRGPTLVSVSTKKEVTLTKEILAESLSSRPVLLVGDVGVGKTMFIRYLMKVAGGHVLQNAIALYVDLGSRAALSTDLRSFFISDIERQLLDDYDVDIRERNFVRGAYHFELERFSRGIHSDLKEIDTQAYRAKEIEFLEEKVELPDNHLRNSLDHISKGRRKQVVLFLDNADQRDEAIQQEAFLIAQELATHWPVTVFIALRPQTFHRSKKLGTLSGYHPKAFTISPPRVDEVVKRRLEFALRITKGEIELKALSSGVSVKLLALYKYLNVLLYSFSHNSDLMEFIDNVCSGNIRLALELVTTFIGSGHVDTKKILDIEDKEAPKSHYLVPLHEFLRAVIHGDNVYYDPQKSPLTNVFDVSTTDGKEHFLLSILIEYIGRASSFAGKEGFVEVASIYEYAQAAGFMPHQINYALIRGLQKNLLESETRIIPNNDREVPRSFRVTTLGMYHVTKLLRHFPYVDSVIVDTPILDDEVRAQVTDVKTIEERLQRCSLFKSYLDNQWDLVDKAAVGFDWKAASSFLAQDIEDIRARTGRSQTS